MGKGDEVKRGKKRRGGEKKEILLQNPWSLRALIHTSRHTRFNTPLTKKKTIEASGK